MLVEGVVERNFVVRFDVHCARPRSIQPGGRDMLVTFMDVYSLWLHYLRRSLRCCTFVHSQILELVPALTYLSISESSAMGAKAVDTFLLTLTTDNT